MNANTPVAIKFFFLWLLFLSLPAFALDPPKTVTERECALIEDAEIIWDLSEMRWVCCISESEELETCIPIRDMKKLPKTSLKPLPPRGTKTIVIPQE